MQLTNGIAARLCFWVGELWFYTLPKELLLWHAWKGNYYLHFNFLILKEQFVLHMLLTLYNKRWILKNILHITIVQQLKCNISERFFNNSIAWIVLKKDFFEEEMSTGQIVYRMGWSVQSQKRTNFIEKLLLRNTRVKFQNYYIIQKTRFTNF